MNRRFFVCLVALLVCGALPGREIKDIPVPFGSKYVRLNERTDAAFGLIGGGGISSSKLVYTVTEEKTKFFFTAGALFEKPFTQYSVVRLECLYAYKGFCVERAGYDEYTGESTEINSEVNLSYIEIPLLFCVGTDRLKDISYYLFGGPQYSYLFSASYITNSTSGNGSHGSLMQIDNYDYGVVAGVGVKYKERLFLEFRYDLGLKEVTINSKSALLENKTFKNKTFWLSVGLIFYK